MARPPEALGSYGVTVCRTWFARGFADGCELQIREELDRIGVAAPLPAGAGRRRRPATLARRPRPAPQPQSSLLRKDPGFYGKLFPDVPDDLPYVWPVRSPGHRAWR